MNGKRKCFLKNFAKNPPAGIDWQEGEWNLEEQNMENRVWQRVLSGPGESGEDLRPLIHSASENVMDYHHLLHRTSGKHRDGLQRLYDRARVNLNCLRGLQAMRFGSAVKVGNLPASGENFRRILEKCYHRTRRAMQEYTARSAEPEFGAVFAVMAHREQDNAALIAEILGTL